MPRLRTYVIWSVLFSLYFICPDTSFSQVQIDGHIDGGLTMSTDPSFAQEAYLKASNTESDDRFTYSVAVSGDTAVVGAVFDDSAFVFTRTAGVWSQQAHLKGSNTVSGDYFGNSVAILGDTVVVGAPVKRAAYVFTRTAGVWSQQAYLNRSYPQFGLSVAASDDTVVVGAVGTAYVFKRTAGVWGQQAMLYGSNTESGDQFGGGVAISGDTLAVVAFFEASSATGVNGDQSDNSAPSSGAAYIFTRTAGVWSQQAYLKASNTDAKDYFGFQGSTGSVTISGDTMVVGAYGESSNSTGVNGDQADNSASYSGAAYVFTRTADVWSQQAYLKASNAEAYDQFGRSVAISEDVLVVGAWEDSNATVVNGDQSDNSAPSSGAAYVFTRSAGVWSQRAYLKASNTEGDDKFGGSVAVSGCTSVVGAPYEDSNATGVNGDQTDNSAPSSGAAYVFGLGFTIGGSVTGLALGNNVTLQDHTGENLVVESDGNFTFKSCLADGSPFTVTVLTQPTYPSQTCSVTNGGGTLAGSNVTDVIVTCVTDTFTMGGTVSGLKGSGLVLQNNAGDDLSIAVDGDFTFATLLEDLSGYSITVLAQPGTPSQTCSVTNGGGTLAGSNVTDVIVTCVTDTFTMGGTVSGLKGSGLVLQNNAGDDLSIAVDGDFTFATLLDDGSDYSVTVLAQPAEPKQHCLVISGNGTVAGSDVNDINVTCSTLPNNIFLDGFE